MMQASESLNFELAKEYRDLIQHINHVTSKQHMFNLQIKLIEIFLAIIKIRVSFFTTFLYEKWKIT